MAFNNKTGDISSPTAHGDVKYYDYFSALWLEITYLRRFCGRLWGLVPPDMVTHRSNPQRHTSLRGNASFDL